MPKSYLVTLPAYSGLTLENGVNAMVVTADDADAALVVARAARPSEPAWSVAGVALIEAPSYADYVLAVALSGSDVDVSVTGGPQATVADIAALAVAAINASADVDGAAYDPDTRVLTVSAAGDAKGDGALTVTLTGPGAVDHSDLLGAVVDGGSSGDAVTVVLPIDVPLGYSSPGSVFALLKSD